MKICVLGLDGAAADVIFGDERLGNLRRLMDLGVYGLLKSVIPPTSIPAWMCMSTSQDPGSLGVYGVRNRQDHGYAGQAAANSSSIKAPAIWDHLARAGKKSIIVGVPPNYPPRTVNGISVGGSTPDAITDDFTYPPALKAEIHALVGQYPVDATDSFAGKHDSPKEEIFSANRKQWTIVRWLLSGQEWDYFLSVDTGLDLMHQNFRKYFDPKHPRLEPGNAYQDTISEYYCWLDGEIGSILDVLEDDTVVLVVSIHGAQSLSRGFAINQWLVREGFLVLNEYPTVPTPFENLNVDWRRTRVWCEGGYYAQVFFNLQGREPQGVVSASDFESLQNEIQARLATLPDENGQAMKSQVFRPREIYRNLRNVAPDLMVHPGGPDWRAIGTVGHAKLQVEENDMAEGCDPASPGMFILVAPNCPLSGEYEGAGVLDLAPTLLDLAGYEIPEDMQGRSLVSGMEKKGTAGGSDEEAKKIVHDRLAGLGYV